MAICIGYSTIETEEAARIGYNGFLFPHEYSIIIYLTCTIIVLLKKYMVWHMFLHLMFRKPNKTTINKNKTTIFIGQRLFDSRLYLDISRSFK